MPNCENCGSWVSGEVCQNCGLWVVQTEITQPVQPVHPAQPMQPYPPQYYQPYPGPYGPPGGKSNDMIVIAVITIVIIAIGAGAFFVFLYLPGGGPINGIHSTPHVSLNWIEDENNPGNYTGNVLRISDGDPPDLSDVTLVYTQGTSTGSDRLSNLEMMNLEVGAMSLIFSDNDANNRIGAADTFSLSGVHDGDIIRLTYWPTAGEMYSTSF